MVEEPSEAETKRAIADAGPGATDREVAGDPLSERPANGPPTVGPANGTSTEPPIGATEPTLKPGQTALPKERSTAKVALIMLSLCVGTKI